MAALRSAVYVTPPIPIYNPSTKGSAGLWSPISCTLIYTSKEAVLVDTPITIEQTNDLIKWIDKIAPGRKLAHIYVTHGHYDHFAGLPLLIEHFKGVIPIATEGTIQHMKDQLEPEAFDKAWASRFPGQIPKPLTLANPLSKDGKFYLEDKYVLQAIECGHTDTYNSTILWIPEIKLAVCGDVIYGQVHQMLAYANTKAKREEWIRAVEIVEKLNPMYVVPGHKQQYEIDGIWHLTNTKKYIQDFGKVLENDPKSPRDIVVVMTKLYPDRSNSGALIVSAQGAFKARKEQKI